MFIQIQQPTNLRVLWIFLKLPKFLYKKSIKKMLFLQNARCDKSFTKGFDVYGILIINSWAFLHKIINLVCVQNINLRLIIERFSKGLPLKGKKCQSFYLIECFVSCLINFLKNRLSYAFQRLKYDVRKFLSFTMFSLFSIILCLLHFLRYTFEGCLI